MDKQNVIHKTVIMTGVAIKDGNIIDAYTVIGTPAQVRIPEPPTRITHILEYNKGRTNRDMAGMTVIGELNTIRELVTIHEGARIGDGNYIMAHTHVGHDVIIGNDTTLAAPKIAGHVRICDGANVGLNATIHQFVTIGHGAMIGMGAVVVDDIPPFTKAVGNPARVIGWNDIGMERAGFTTERIREIKDWRSPEWFEFEQVRHRRLAKLWFGDEEPQP